MLVAAVFADAVKDLSRGWALSIWFQAVFAGLLVGGSAWLPESPRWLCMESRRGEAHASLRWLRRDKTGEQVEAETWPRCGRDIAERCVSLSSTTPRRQRA